MRLELYTLTYFELFVNTHYSSKTGFRSVGNTFSLAVSDHFVPKPKRWLLALVLTFNCLCLTYSSQPHCLWVFLFISQSSSFWSSSWKFQFLSYVIKCWHLSRPSPAFMLSNFFGIELFLDSALIPFIYRIWIMEGSFICLLYLFLQYLVS